MLSDYLHVDVSDFIPILTLIAAVYSVVSTILGTLTLAICWGKLDEALSDLRSLRKSKKPAPQVDESAVIEDVLPVDESAVIEPIEPALAGADL
jgi:hypothetical protein